MSDGWTPPQTGLAPGSNAACVRQERVDSQANEGSANWRTHARPWRAARREPGRHPGRVPRIGQAAPPRPQSRKREGRRIVQGCVRRQFDSAGSREAGKVRSRRDRRIRARAAPTRVLSRPRGRWFWPPLPPNREVAPENGTTGFVGRSLLRMTRNGANQEEDETHARRGLQGQDRPRGDAGTGDGARGRRHDPPSGI